MDVFAQRRAVFLEQMGEGVAVIPSSNETIRNNDVTNPYRQDSDFFYLTGFDEPDSLLVLEHKAGTPKMTLFVPPRDPERETWDGPRAGVDGAKSEFGADEAFNNTEVEKHLPRLIEGTSRLHYGFGRADEFDATLFEALHHVRRKAKRQGAIAPSELVDPSVVLHEQRIRKDAVEVETMRKAAAITRDAHIAAMKITQPGMHEFEVEAELTRVFRKNGSQRAAYESIVGSGPNATILHYRKNDRLMEDGDLLLIDAGCELDYYASDVTRTFPVNGRFTEPQRKIYEIVLKAQLDAIEAVKPGATLDDVHEAAVRAIASGLLELGLLEGTLAEQLESKGYRDFYMHKTSHWIGMDVHDVGAYFSGGKPRPFEPGFVLTVEPGIYIAVDADVDPQWRGIGIRIEDDILVTESGYENLSPGIPKTVEEIEAACAG